MEYSRHAPTRLSLLLPHLLGVGSSHVCCAKDPCLDTMWAVHKVCPRCAITRLICRLPHLLGVGRLVCRHIEGAGVHLLQCGQIALWDDHLQATQGTPAHHAMCSMRAISWCSLLPAHTEAPLITGVTALSNRCSASGAFAARRQQNLQGVVHSTGGDRRSMTCMDRTMGHNGILTST